MHMEFTVSVDAERTEGKFASREELEEQVRAELAGAEMSQLDGDNGGVYEVQSWEVEVVEQKRRRR